MKTNDPRWKELLEDSHNIFKDVKTKSNGEILASIDQIEDALHEVIYRGVLLALEHIPKEKIYQDFFGDDGIVTDFGKIRGGSRERFKATFDTAVEVFNKNLNIE